MFFFQNPKIKNLIRDTLGKQMGFRVYKIKVFKNALKNPERLKDIILYTLSKFYGQKDYIKFIILSRARTGSTLLQLMLNAHPAIHAKSEIFTRLYGSPVQTVLNDIFAPHPARVKAVGFKIFYNHPVDDDSGRVWETLKKMEDLKVIHLKRKNMLRSLISEKIARKTNVWGIKKNDNRIRTQRKTVTLTVEDMEQTFQQVKEWEKKYQRMFQAHPMIDVHYEDLIDNPEMEFQKITRFLGVDFIVPEIKLRRQNPESVFNLVENYGFLKKHFTGTQWQGYFEDESG
jgi:LPS sulfotransferase NodH